MTCLTSKKGKGGVINIILTLMWNDSKQNSYETFKAYC